MGRTATLDPPTLDWCRRRFAEYYRTHRVEPPPRFTRREFAAFPFTTQTLMRRHAAFRSAEELEQFLARETPRHVYYSSAYYRAPSHATMAAKGWLGADVIFDLDADHLRQAGGKSYAEQLALARSRFLDLVDGFLFGDFGLDPTDVSLVFSGGRGYHAHVHAESFLGLSSSERRELVDYVLGGNPDLQAVLARVRETDRGGALAFGGGPEVGGGDGGRSSPGRQRPFRRLVPPDTPGWPGRASRAFLSVLGRWRAGGPALAAQEMRGFGVPGPVADEWADRLVTRGGAQRVQETLSLEVFSAEFPPTLVEAILREATIEVQGETDAPVTTDIHRLIRLPGSLHGGTGFRVAPLTRDELDRFDPFRDARPFADGEPVERVLLLATVDYPTQPVPARGREGETLELPRSAALFLTTRGEARPVDAGPPPAAAP